MDHEVILELIDRNLCSNLGNVGRTLSNFHYESLLKKGLRVILCPLKSSLDSTHQPSAVVAERG